MNVGEASAVNTVLSQLLGTGRERPDREALRDACFLLARNSHRALMAGIDVGEVDEAFDQGRVARRPRPRPV